MWFILLQILFYCGICQVQAIIEYNVTNDFRGIFIYHATKEINYYEIEANASHWIDISHHFQRGELFHSFECTFRLDPNKTERATNFSLIHIQNANKTFHLSINLILKENLVKLAFKKNAIKTVYSFHFNKTVDFLDGKWHNVMYGVHNFKHEDNSIDFWIDCTKQAFHHIRQEVLPEKDTFYFLKNLILKIGEIHGGEKNESVPLEISKMRFHGYSRMPIYARCEDIKKNVTQEPEVKSEIQLTKVHVYHHMNKTEFHYDSDEIVNFSDESYESMSDSGLSSEEEYTPHREEKVNTVSSVFGFIFFVCFIGATAFLLKKYY